MHSHNAKLAKLLGLIALLIVGVMFLVEVIILIYSMVTEGAGWYHWWLLPWFLILLTNGFTLLIGIFSTAHRLMLIFFLVLVVLQAVLDGIFLWFVFEPHVMGADIETAEDMAILVYKTDFVQTVRKAAIACSVITVVVCLPIQIVMLVLSWTALAKDRHEQADLERSSHKPNNTEAPPPPPVSNANVSPTRSLRSRT